MNTQILRNKNLYKITAIFVKYAPIILALLQMIMTGLNYLGISISILGLIGGSSLMFQDYCTYYLIYFSIVIYIEYHQDIH